MRRGQRALDPRARARPQEPEGARPGAASRTCRPRVSSSSPREAALTLQPRPPFLEHGPAAPPSSGSAEATPTPWTSTTGSRDIKSPRLRPPLQPPSAMAMVEHRIDLPIVCLAGPPPNRACAPSPRHRNPPVAPASAPASSRRSPWLADGAPSPLPWSTLTGPAARNGADAPGSVPGSRPRPHGLPPPATSPWPPASPFPAVSIFPVAEASCFS